MGVVLGYLGNSSAAPGSSDSSRTVGPDYSSASGLFFYLVPT